MKGLKALQEQAEKMGKGSRSDYLQLWMRDGETAQFYFITDADDAPVIHLIGVPKTGRRGEYHKDTLSLKEHADDETPCPLWDKAVSPDDNGYTGPWARIAFYVYVENIFHVSRDKPEWKAVPAGDSTLYVEPRNEVRLFVPKQGTIDQIAELTAPDPTDPDSKEIGVRDVSWRIKVTKQSNRNVEQLIRGTKMLETLPDHVLEAEAELPPLMDTLEKTFGPRGGGDSNSGGAAVRQRAVEEETSPDDFQDVEF